MAQKVIMNTVLKNNLYKLLLVTGIIVLAQACTTKKDTPQPACANFPDSVSFKADIIPILTTNCAISGCHTTPNPQSELNLSASVAYSQLLNVGDGYVTPGNPGTSVMYSSITNPSQIMPPTGQMNSCTIDLIKIWIQQGAKNN